MSQRQLWLFSPDNSGIDLPGHTSLQLGAGKLLENQTVVVPVSRWAAYVASLAGMDFGPARVILYMDEDVPEPERAWELSDAVVERGDATGLEEAIAGRYDDIIDQTADLPTDVLRAIVDGERLGNLSPFEDVTADEDLAVVVRRAATLELALRGLHPIGGTVTAQVAGEAAVASLIAAIILVGWVRAGLRPRPGPALRGTEEDPTVTPEDVEAVLDAGLSLEGTLGTASLTFSFAADTPEGPSLLVSAAPKGLTLEVRRSGETVWSAPLHPSPIGLPLSTLREGDRVVISPSRAAP